MKLLKLKVDNNCLLASVMPRPSRRGALPAYLYSNSGFCYLLTSWPPGQKVWRCLLDKANKISKKNAKIPSQVMPRWMHLACAVKITMGWMESHSGRWTLLFKGHPPSAIRTALFLCSFIKVLETILRVRSVLVQRCSTELCWVWRPLELSDLILSLKPVSDDRSFVTWSIVLLESSIRRCRIWNWDSSDRLLCES